jgi:hypothetical protein
MDRRKLVAGEALLLAAPAIPGLITGPAPAAYDPRPCQTPEEERLQELNDEIQCLREELRELEDIEGDQDLWNDLYENPRVKHHIIVREEERSHLVSEHNRQVRQQMLRVQQAARIVGTSSAAIRTTQPTNGRKGPRTSRQRAKTRGRPAFVRAVLRKLLKQLSRIA